MRIIRSIVSVTLAVIVLAASVGVTMNMHLCGGKVQSTALFVKAEPCGMMKLQSHATHSTAKKHKKCCDEQSLVFKTSEDNAETGSVTNVVPSFHLFTSLLPVIGLAFPVTTSKVAIPEVAYTKPPLPERDITVLVRAFLI